MAEKIYIRFLKALYDKGGVANTKEIKELSNLDVVCIHNTSRYLHAMGMLSIKHSWQKGKNNSKPTLKGLNTYKMTPSTFKRMPDILRRHSQQPDD